MSGSEWVPRPYVVGEENVYVLGIQGIVESVTSESLTINGHVLPRVMTNGVRYMSMMWPDAPCEWEHCSSACDPEPADSDARDELDGLIAMVTARHEETHNDSLRFCSDSLCREVWGLQ